VQAAKDLLSQMLDEDSEILTILKGEDASQEDVDSIVEFVENEFSDLEIEVHNGEQPLYAFIFAIE
jgi:uncharacterized protein